MLRSPQLADDLSTTPYKEGWLRQTAYRLDYNIKELSTTPYKEGWLRPPIKRGKHCGWFFQPLLTKKDGCDESFIADFDTDRILSTTPYKEGWLRHNQTLAYNAQRLLSTTPYKEGWLRHS